MLGRSLGDGAWGSLAFTQRPHTFPRGRPWSQLGWRFFCSDSLGSSLTFWETVQPQPAEAGGQGQEAQAPCFRQGTPGRQDKALRPQVLPGEEEDHTGSQTGQSLLSESLLPISQVTMDPSLNFSISKTETTEPCLWRRLGTNGGHRGEQPAPDLAQSCAPYVRTSRSCPRSRGVGQALCGWSTLLNCYVNILWRRLKGLVFVCLF